MMADTNLQSGTGGILLTDEARSLIEAFSQIGKCACAILDASTHMPLVHAGWRPEWEEFSSVLPHRPERFFKALSKIKWGDVAERSVTRFESAGNIVHALAPVHDGTKLKCFLYAGYLLGSRPDYDKYKNIARERKIDEERFLLAIKDIPILPDSALTASLSKLVTQVKSLLDKAPASGVDSAPAAPPPYETAAPANDAPSYADEPLPWEQTDAPAGEAAPRTQAQPQAPAPVQQPDMHAQIIRSLTRDIRSALNGSIGVTGMLMRRRDPEITDMLGTVHRSNDTLLNMLDNLHDYYDVISGQMPLSNAPFDVRIATERAVESVRNRVEETGVTLNLRFTEDMPDIVSGDAARFQQVLRNALLTVARYAVGGRVMVAAKKGADRPDGVEMQFLVQNVIDTAADHPPAIDDDPTIKVYDSSDIGMVVSREIVRLLGGKMVVRTTEPPSTIFSFIAPEINLDGYAFDTAASQTLKQRSVVVIHNEEQERAAIALQCGYWGPHVKSFAAADDAYTWLNANEPADAVLIGADMPMKDAFLNKLNSSRMHTALPAIVYAGNRPIENVTPKQTSNAVVAVWDTLRSTLEEAIQNASLHAPPPDSGGTLADSHPNSILVVEDDSMNRQLVQRILKKLGYAPMLTANGIEAVKAASQKKFDLVFMDLQMPGMDGITAAKTILNDTVHGVPPKIIALSANASHSDREGAFKSGMVDFLAKPIILDKMQDAIMKWGNRADAAEPKLETSGESANAKLVDADIISQTRELDSFSDESILDRLIQGFIKEVPPIINEMEKGFTSNNTYKVTKGTSTLKGMCRNLGIKEFSSIADRVEKEALDADIASMSKLFKSLRKSYQETIAELKLYLTS